MLLAIVRFLPPIAALIAIIFLIIRFRLFSTSEHQGRPAILIGSLLVLSASFWQTVRAIEWREIDKQMIYKFGQIGNVDYSITINISNFADWRRSRRIIVENE